ncbi:MAG: hypothetical protein HUU54_12805 [Ignavibacteriaceae bacterium]|nr:hypothetical protein [Ignavibacteriaceae bacterium]
MNKYFLLILAASFIVAGCSSGIKITSQPPAAAAVIDGDVSEWSNMTQIKNENLAFSFSNDDKFLYVAMVTGDRRKMMRIMAGGLQVWLEPDNTAEKFGVLYPEPPDPAEIRKQLEERMARGEERRPDPQRFRRAHNKLFILNSEEARLEEFPSDGATYQARLEADRDRLAYELRIPIGADINPPAGLQVKPGESIKVRFITGEIMPFGPGGDMPQMSGGEGPPMGGGRPGMGGRGGMGGRPEMEFKPFDFEFNVKLN